MKQSLAFTYNRQVLHAKVLPHLWPNGMHYEINIPGFDRFYLYFGPLKRYQLSVGSPKSIPEDLVLLLSDLLEEQITQ